MPTPAEPTEPDRETGDQAALLLMLTYVEAECLRMGATEAARHAALAASLVANPSKHEGHAARFH